MVPDSPPHLAFDALDLPPDEVERRIRWGREQGHPHYVWPDVSPALWRACRSEIGRVVSAVLADAKRPAHLHLPDGAGPKALGVAAFTSGVGPLLGRWIEDGRVSAAPDLAALLELHLRHGRRRADELHARLRSLGELLGGEGIPVVALKGAHTGRDFFPEPGSRPSSDLDLLVPPDRFDDAGRVLDNAGYGGGTRKSEPPTREWTAPGPPRRVRSLELAHAENPLELDLHGSLDRDYFRVGTVELGWPGPDDRRPMSGVPGVDVLDEPLLTSFLAAHASHGLLNLTLVRLVELVLVVRQGLRSGRLDWAELERRLADAGGTRFVLPAFALVEKLVPGTVSPPFLDRLRSASPPRMRRVVEGLDPAGAPTLDRTPVDQRLMWAATPADHLRRFLDFLWPRSEGDSWSRRLRVWRNRIAVLLRGRVG